MPVISMPFEQSQKASNPLTSAVNLSLRGGTSTNEKTQQQPVPMKACDAVLASTGLNQTLPAMPMFNEPSAEASQLNETWPLPDPPNTIIASCLRLTANFLIQSAAFFENKAFAELPSCLSLISAPILSMPFYPSFSDPPTPSVGTADPGTTHCNFNASAAADDASLTSTATCNHNYSTPRHPITGLSFLIDTSATEVL
ncbi:unnamed protein product [Dibothriocephalus latus]|uniref:Uncharacterized protein n=1 Tax=Dibothriocephalus latus TaxID=60516 RepID=A0A3P7N1K5_DIBLA|nr:unnamed protein product [Dibothriocephalus latus]